MRRVRIRCQWVGIGELERTAPPPALGRQQELDLGAPHGFAEKVTPQPRCHHCPWPPHCCQGCPDVAPAPLCGHPALPARGSPQPQLCVLALPSAEGACWAREWLHFPRCILKGVTSTAGSLLSCRFFYLGSIPADICGNNPTSSMSDSPTPVSLKWL